MSNLPDFSGASVCYSRAQRLLAHMASRVDPATGRVMPCSGRPRRHRRDRSYIVRTADMDELIKALDAGGEERIKGLLLQHDAVAIVG